jgi:hypothetical protein
MVVLNTSHNDIRPLKKSFKSERCAQPCAEMARILSIVNCVLSLFLMIRRVEVSKFFTLQRNILSQTLFSGKTIMTNHWDILRRIFCITSIFEIDNFYI